MDKRKQMRSSAISEKRNPIRSSTITAYCRISVKLLRSSAITDQTFECVFFLKLFVFLLSYKLKVESSLVTWDSVIFVGGIPPKINSNNICDILGSTPRKSILNIYYAIT